MGRLMSLIGLSLLVAACGGGDGADEGNGAPKAQVRIIHAAADAPMVDFSMSGGATVSGIDYGRGSPRGNLDAGSYSASFRGHEPEGKRTLVPARDYEFEENLSYDVVVLGDYADPDVAVFSRQTAVDSDRARLTLAHLNADFGEVDVYLTEVDAPIGQAVPEGTLDYRESLPSMRVEAGKYRIRLTNAGEAGVIYDSGELSFSAGSDYFAGIVENVWLSSAQSPQSPLLLAVFAGSNQALIADAGWGAYLRAYHASADAPALDVVAEEAFDAPLAEGLSFGERSAVPVAVPRDSLNVQVLASGTTSAYVDKVTDLTGRGDYVMFIANILADMEVVFLPDNPRRIASQASWRVVNMASQQEELDVYLVAPGTGVTGKDPEVEDLAFGRASGFLPLSAGTVQLLLTGKNSKTPLAEPVDVDLEEGGIYTFVLHDGEGLTGLDAAVIANEK